MAFDFSMEFIRALGFAGTVSVVARRVGLRGPGFYFVLSALCALPVGEILANPARYRFSPTEAEFEHSPYGAALVAYMALSGLSGLTFAWLRERRGPASGAASRP